MSHIVKGKALIDGKSYGPFSSRADAIAFEKDEIYKQGKFFAEAPHEAAV
ncbi:MAG: hypothetical protein HWE24_14145 [Oceanospirillaceae bacterium]|nr:hypothetical protein [Oceanospirillaceae bacterium]